MKGEILTNSNKDVKRRDLDFYPTPNEVTEALIKSFRIEKQLIWECACGIGNMSKVLKKYNDVISTDISENSYGETNIDFLKTYRVSDWIITNPPFKLSSLFIEHATSQCDNVAFLLKTQYWHASKRTELFRNNPPAYILALNWRPDFLFGEKGGSPTMDVCWNVWITGDTNTKYRVLSKPIDF